VSYAVGQRLLAGAENGVLMIEPPRGVHGDRFPLQQLAPIGGGSIRRTATIDARPDGTWREGTMLDARGRDLLADAAGRTRTYATHEFSARVDAAGTLQRAGDADDRQLPAELVGIDARRGFRGALAAYYGPTGRTDSLEAALLDDLPGMRIISGYAQLREHTVGQSSSLRHSPSIGVCVGWRAGGTAAGSDEALPDMLASRPVAPHLVGRNERVWHADPPPPPSGMRRRRLIEVAPGDTTAVYGYFRDTYCQPDRVEVVVHEYEITATLAGIPPAVLDLGARPGALPLAECPAAAGEVVLLHGVLIGDVEAEVRSRLTGPHGCTHLNDLLRTLRLVEPMTALFRAAHGERPGQPEEFTS